MRTNPNPKNAAQPACGGGGEHAQYRTHPPVSDLLHRESMEHGTVVPVLANANAMTGPRRPPSCGASSMGQVSRWLLDHPTCEPYIFTPARRAYPWGIAPAVAALYDTGTSARHLRHRSDAVEYHTRLLARYEPLSMTIFLVWYRARPFTTVHDRSRPNGEDMSNSNTISPAIYTAARVE